MSGILWVLVTHQPGEKVARMIEFWKNFVPEERILVLHGGREADFEAVAHPQKAFVADPKLRTRDHQREMQSLSGILRAASGWLEGRPDFDHVYLAEYDQIPVAPDLEERLLHERERQDADLLAHWVGRVDGTSNPHYLYHAARPAFIDYWKQIGHRADPRVVLSMFGTGSFWTRRAWTEVAALSPGFDIYFELFLPTAAHHLGFRVREFEGQNRFVINRPHSPAITLAEARAAGAWTLHPVKTLWDGVTLPCGR